MKVCAWINTGPFQNRNERFDSIAEAVDYFRREVADPCSRQGYCTDDNDGCYVMDLYEQCDRCAPMMNFHDHPMVRYSVGPRCGLRRERC
jgi:hypothetical protein